ncbi:MAG: type IV secretion system DNA-binding domain-containing protein [Armatimonadetes bacterium]|nr:type IV secretion system DNA-binding domain-containing protein [Armatimonadota bacterium]
MDSLPVDGENVAVIGAIGSGKSVLMNRFATSVFEHGPTRVLVYDAKSELIPYLAGTAGFDKLKIFNPWDARGVGWNLGEDITNVLASWQFTNLLIPQREGGTDRFWDDAARDVIQAVLRSFLETIPNEGSFTFSDVMRSLTFPNYLRFWLEQKACRNGAPFLAGKRVLASYLDNADEKVAKNIWSTISSAIGIWEPVAAAWQDATEGYSLKRWIEGKDVIVLGGTEGSRAVTDVINRMIFDRSAQLILDKEERAQHAEGYDDDLTFYLLDELPSLGKTLLNSLLLKGRSKGVITAFAVQTKASVESVYGKEAAIEILGQAGCLAVLKLNDSDTATWAAQQFGSFIVDIPSAGTTTGQGNVSFSNTRSESERTLFQTSHFLYLPKASAQNGIWGLFRNPYRSIDEPIMDHLRWNEDIEPYLGIPSDNPDHAAFIPRPASDFVLKPFTNQDWARLGFEGSPPPPFDEGTGGWVD